MLGLGESEAEIQQAMDDLRSASGVDILTFGQYLRPTVQKSFAGRTLCSSG